MSNREDYAKKLETISSIPQADVLKPNMPVAVYAQEADNVYDWASDDRHALLAAGLSWDLVEDIPVRSGALRQAQSLWNKTRFGREEAQKQWDQSSEQAFDLRDHILHSMRYAYRNDAELLNRVRDIAEGSTNPDMIQDLNDAAVLGKANLEPLKSINFDPGLLDQAAQKSDEMSALLAAATGDRQADSAVKLVRDQAYTHLKQAVDEVRACGQYVFWKNPDRAKGYASEYLRQNRQKASAKANPST